MYYRSFNRIRARAKLPALTERTFEIRVVKLEHRIQRDFIHRGSHAQQQMDMRLVEDSSTHREQIDDELLTRRRSLLRRTRKDLMRG